MLLSHHRRRGVPLRRLLDSDEPIVDGGDDVPATETTPEFYQPSVSDVLVVKAMLSKALDLPNELVDRMVEIAEYWPHTSAESPDADCDENGVFKIVRSGDPPNENRFLIRSQPLGFPPVPQEQLKNYTTRPIPAAPLQQEFPTEYFQNQIKSSLPLLQYPCRMIVFTFESRDQGWGQRAGPTDHIYSGSWTWFSAGLERFDATDDNPREGSPAVGANDDTTSKTTQNVKDAVEKGGHMETDQAASSQSALLSPTYEENLERIRTVWPESQLKYPASTPADSTMEVDGPEYEYVETLLPLEDRKIQANVTKSGREITRHRVVWKFSDDIDPESDQATEELEQKGRGRGTGNGAFVRSLKLGDIVTVWAHSRFAHWENVVKNVKIEVYYAV